MEKRSLVLTRVQICASTTLPSQTQSTRESSASKYSTCSSLITPRAPLQINSFVCIKKEQIQKGKQIDPRSPSTEIEGRPETPPPPMPPGPPGAR